MINVGDKLLCIKTSELDYRVPQVVKGRYYIANGVRAGHCGNIGIDVGLSWINRPKYQECPKCKKLVKSDDVPHYLPSRFAKVEESKEYRVVEVSETIKEQRKDLILQ